MSSHDDDTEIASSDREDEGVANCMRPFWDSDDDDECFPREHLDPWFHRVLASGPLPCFSRGFNRFLRQRLRRGPMEDITEEEAKVWLINCFPALAERVYGTWHLWQRTYLTRPLRKILRDKDEDDSCPICTAEYDGYEHAAVRIRCRGRHLMCIECAENWFKPYTEGAQSNCNKCPFCRYKQFDFDEPPQYVPVYFITFEPGQDPDELIDYADYSSDAEIEEDYLAMDLIGEEW